MDNEMMTIQDIRKEATVVLEAGQRLAAKASARGGSGKDRSRLVIEALGGALAKPSEFWAGACVIESESEVMGFEALALSVRYASARMAVGDFDFVRESLVGQSNWCSVLAVKLADQAEDKPEKYAPLYKLAMQAQRQAAQALATAAALNKLVDADSVVVA